MKLRKLEGKVAVVTGSGRGIGRAVALKLASEGARVVVNDLDDEVAASVVKEIGENAVACNGDVAAPDFGERLIETALKNFNGLDIIVNNAGYTWDNVIQKTTDEQFDAMIDVHLKAPFRILRAAAGPIRAMVKKEAANGQVVARKVVNISSIAGLFGNPGQAGYASAKAAVTGLTRTLAKEWGRYNVTVNCVAFGLIETRLMQPLTDSDNVDAQGRKLQIGVRPEALEITKALTPLGRFGTPEEAAGAVYLFCLPESNYISGQVVIAGGGLQL